MMASSISVCPQDADTSWELPGPWESKRSRGTFQILAQLNFEPGETRESPTFVEPVEILEPLTAYL